MNRPSTRDGESTRSAGYSTAAGGRQDGPGAGDGGEFRRVFQSNMIGYRRGGQPSRWEGLTSGTVRGARARSDDRVRDLEQAQSPWIGNGAGEGSRVGEHPDVSDFIGTAVGTALHDAIHQIDHAKEGTVRHTDSAAGGRVAGPPRRGVDKQRAAIIRPPPGLLERAGRGQQGRGVGLTDAHRSHSARRSGLRLLQSHVSLPGANKGGIERRPMRRSSNHG